MKVAVLITCHNRREKTLHCLQSLHSARLPGGVELDVWLVDDGSTDGTGTAVLERFPGVHVVRGNGNLFWCAGMNLAWLTAAPSEPDAYLWLNDDVELLPDGLATLLQTAENNPDAIVVGSCVSPVTGQRSYGGLRRLGAHPGKLAPVPPGERPVSCDTFEGNVVWVPASVFRRIGPLKVFQHAMGDIDYGYRAAEVGIPRVLAPGFLGRCATNAKDATWEDSRLPWRVRWRKLRSVKGLPAPDWWRFCFGHGGWRAPIYFLGPFLRIMLRR